MSRSGVRSIAACVLFLEREWNRRWDRGQIVDLLLQDMERQQLNVFRMRLLGAEVLLQSSIWHHRITRTTAGQHRHLHEWRL